MTPDYKRLLELRDACPSVTTHDVSDAGSWDMAAYDAFCEAAYAAIPELVKLITELEEALYEADAELEQYR